MSFYSFIASDKKLPSIDNTSSKIITVKEAKKLGIKAHELMPWEDMDPTDEVLIFEKESDLDELVIREDRGYEDNVRWYTDKKFIYSLEFRYSNKRGLQLLDYLKTNIKQGQKLELWLIWLDDKQDVEPLIVNYNEISIKHLREMYELGNESSESHRCIKIFR